MKIGAWQPGDLRVDIEHQFADVRDPLWPKYVREIQERGRLPLLTLLPYSGIGATIEYLSWVRGPLWLRYGHEFNGTWYPWCGRPDALKRDWRAIKAALPDGGKLVWCPNIDYPGADPIDRYWPGDDIVDLIGLDGYDQIAGNPPRTFKELFQPTRDCLKPRGKTLVVCETGTPRGARQRIWLQAMWRTACAWEELAAIVYFNQDKSKQSSNERNWTLTDEAAAMFERGPRRCS